MMTESSPLLELFRTYNPDMWPLPVVAYGLSARNATASASRSSRMTVAA